MLYFDSYDLEALKNHFTGGDTFSVEQSSYSGMPLIISKISEMFGNIITFANKNVVPSVLNRIITVSPRDEIGFHPVNRLMDRFNEVSPMVERSRALLKKNHGLAVLTEVEDFIAIVLDSIKKLKLGESISDLSSVVSEESSDLILSNLIEANLYNLGVNLASQSSSDLIKTPIGKLFYVLEQCFYEAPYNRKESFLDHLHKIDQKPLKERKKDFHSLSGHLTDALLKKLFPKGSQDVISIKYLGIPTKIGFSYIEGELPTFLPRILEETRPLRLAYCAKNQLEIACGHGTAKMTEALIRDLFKAIPTAVVDYYELAKSFLEQDSVELFPIPLTPEQFEAVCQEFKRLAESNQLKAKALLNTCKVYQNYSEEKAKEVQKILECYKALATQGLITPQKIIEKIKGMISSKKIKKIVDENELYLTKLVRLFAHGQDAEFAHGRDGEFAGVWEFLESFLITQSLNTISRAQNLSFDDLKTLNIFKLFASKEEDQLFGIPPTLSMKICDLANAQFPIIYSHSIEALSKLNDLCHEWNHCKDHFQTAEHYYPFLKPALLNVTQKILDKQTLTYADDLGERGVQELTIALSSAPKKDTTEVALQLLQDQKYRAKLKAFFVFLNKKENDPYKKSIAEWGIPLIAPQIDNAINNVLHNENSEMDKELFLQSLPIVSKYLKLLREGRTELTSSDEEKSIRKKWRKKSYENHASFIFNFIFPNGKTDLGNLTNPFLPDKEDQLWNDGQKITAKLISEVPSKIFDKKLIDSICFSALKGMTEALRKPIAIEQSSKSSVSPVFSPLTQRESSQNNEMTPVLKTLVTEVLLFFGLSLDPLSSLPFGKALTDKIFNLLGKSILDQCDGKLFKKALDAGLKAAVEYEAEIDPDYEKLMEQMEEDLTQAILAFPFRMLAAIIDDATDIFKEDNFLSSSRSSIVAISSYIYGTMIPSILRLMKIETFFSSRIKKAIHHTIETVSQRFSNRELESLDNNDFDLENAKQKVKEDFLLELVEGAKLVLK